MNNIVYHVPHPMDQRKREAMKLKRLDERIPQLIIEIQNPNKIAIFVASHLKFDFVSLAKMKDLYVRNTVLLTNLDRTEAAYDCLFEALRKYESTDIAYLLFFPSKVWGIPIY